MARAARSRRPYCPFTVDLDRAACSRPSYYVIRFKFGSGRLGHKICHKGHDTLEATQNALARLFHCRVPKSR